MLQVYNILYDSFQELPSEVTSKIVRYLDLSDHEEWSEKMAGVLPGPLLGYLWSG